MPNSQTARTGLFVMVGLALLFAESAVAQPVARATTTETLPFTRARGAIPPGDLDALVTAQHATTQMGNLLLGAAVNVPPVSRPVCSPAAEAFDWNKLRKVTPVGDQGKCASCWAFGAVGAYESSYLIENGLVVPPEGKASASEKQALDCAWSAYSCNGGWHNKVFDYFESPGETTKTAYPYPQPPEPVSKAACKTVSPIQYTAAQWDYIQGANIPSNAQLKAAICEHGPIVAAVDSTNWDRATSDNKHYMYSTENPDFTREFPDGVYRYGKPSNPSLSMATLQKGDVDHDVLIVGWDDHVHAWIIKNSWGTHWGNQGYLKLAYNTSNLGFSAAWIRASRIQQPPAGKALWLRLQAINRGFKADYLRSLETMK